MNMEALRVRSCTQLAAALGVYTLPPPRAPNAVRTLESVRRELQRFFDERGRRPTSKEFHNIDMWLKRRDWTVRTLCDDMGLSGGKIVTRTMSAVRQEIQTVYDREGRRPLRRELDNGNVQWLLYNFKMTVNDLCDQMGLPGRKTQPSLKRARADIQEFYDREGRRPLCKEMVTWVNFLKKTKRTLGALCDEMGLPEGSRKHRTMERFRREIQEIYDREGRRPITKEMASWGAWLRAHHRGTTLHGVCNQMGLPSRMVRSGKQHARRSAKEVHRKIQEFYKREGRRPMNKEVPRCASWLKEQGTSLQALCDEMGFSVRGYTMETARCEIQEFYDREGHRPRHQDLPKLSAWFRSQEMSLPKFGEKMGLSPIRRVMKDRTMASVRAECQSFFDTHQRRPGIKDLQKLDAWLRNRNSSLLMICDGLGFPPNLRWDRTEEEAVRVTKKFFAENGRRPQKTDMSAWNAWLGTHGKSLRILSDELGLPKERNYDRSLEKAREAMLEFFNEHGKRPAQADLQAWEGWLRNHHGSSVSRLCDELGLRNATQLRRAS